MKKYPTLVGWVALAACNGVLAQQAPVALNIAAQPLGKALNSWASQTGYQILIPADRVAQGRAAPRVAGTYTPEAALKALLASSNDLDYQFVNDRTVMVRLAQTSAAASVQSAPAGGDSKGSSALPLALAQSSPRENQVTASDESRSAASASNGTIQEVLVTAQKRSENVQKVPISISVLSGQELDRRTSEGVTEILNNVPGVATQQNYLGGGSVIVIRGVAPARTFSSGASPVAYYIDSVPFGLVKSAVGPDTDAYDLERVEVLRGPQGTLYGANALNGVVRVLTHDADLRNLDFKTRLADSYTQYGGNNYRGDLAVNVPLVEDKLAIRGVAGYTNNSGWIDQPNKSNANWTEVGTYRLKVNAQPTDDLSIGLSGWSSRVHSGAPNVGYRFDQDGSQINQPLFSDFDAYGAKLAYQLPAVLISSATSYLHYTNAGTLGLDVPFYKAPNSLFFNSIGSNTLSEELNLTSSTSGPWRWSLGGMYRRATENDYQYFTGAFAGVPLFISNNTSRSWAAYGELTRLLLSNRLELTAGLRHFRDDVDEYQGSAPTKLALATTTATANTPRGVVTYHLTDRQMAYASYSQGFRSGFPQIGLPSGFPTVLPDRLRNYEIGSKGTIAGISYDVSVYYMKWSGIQEQLRVPYFNVQALAIVNGESASGIGSDVSLTFEPLKHLTLTTGVSWNNLTLDGDVLSGGAILFHKGDRTTSSPETTAAVSAAYAFPIGSQGMTGHVVVSGNYTSSQAYRGLTGPALTIQDGDPMVITRAEFVLQPAANWSASLYGDNLNNERGAPVRAFIRVENWDARVRPRTVGIQLQYHFK